MDRHFLTALDELPSSVRFLEVAAGGSQWSPDELAKRTDERATAWLFLEAQALIEIASIHDAPEWIERRMREAVLKLRRLPSIEAQEASLDFMNVRLADVHSQILMKAWQAIPSSSHEPSKSDFSPNRDSAYASPVSSHNRYFSGFRLVLAPVLVFAGVGVSLFFWLMAESSDITITSLDESPPFIEVTQPAQTAGGNPSAEHPLIFTGDPFKRLVVEKLLQSQEAKITLLVRLNENGASILASRSDDTYDFPPGFWQNPAVDAASRTEIYLLLNIEHFCQLADKNKLQNAFNDKLPDIVSSTSKQSIGDAIYLTLSRFNKCGRISVQMWICEHLPRL